MFSSSSRPGTHVNSDGTRNVFCYSCRDFIMTTREHISSSLCAMCEMILSGKPIPEETLKQYMLSKQTKVDVSMLLLEEEDSKDFKAKFSLRSMGGGIIRALGFAKPKTEEPASMKVARGKKRPRLFENVDLGDSSMEAVDAALKKHK